MSGEMESARLRLSHEDRERVVAHLQACTAEGRLDLDEFAARSSAVYEARTFGDLKPLLADLPATAAGETTAGDDELLAPRGSSMTRNGRWLVPRRLRLKPRSSSMKLDFTEAVIGHRQVDVELNTKGSSIVLVLPPDAWAEESVSLRASSATNKVPFTGDRRGVRFVVTGEIKGSSLTIRRRQRFLWWWY
ncbi:uncharacterized protein DUF1707 [Stackebrandtia albiflava]|uniref:Uncharacterized protein DUF1707 n=1 Tax=Stackebrandtia albiflava TaxID=406432 RepID=A0A562V0W3_9ACTN|nr:DUF1707 domain-containing protein [Stackebrandtia albiflava]TWJ11556.1 uncharacterized protein DUF1707 [Stackebrandtia albiflava]